MALTFEHVFSEMMKSVFRLVEVVGYTAADVCGRFYMSEIVTLGSLHEISRVTMNELSQ